MEREAGGMKICPVCKKEFYVPILINWTYAKRSKNKVEILYCSWTCYRSNVKKVEKKHCINCGKEIIGNGQLFCDYYCRVDYEQLHREEPRKIISGRLLV